VSHELDFYFQSNEGEKTVNFTFLMCILYVLWSKNSDFWSWVSSPPCFLLVCAASRSGVFPVEFSVCFLCLVRLLVYSVLRFHCHNRILELLIFVLRSQIPFWPGCLHLFSLCSSFCCRRSSLGSRSHFPVCLFT
jgi:hypothetical protein